MSSEFPSLPKIVVSINAVFWKFHRVLLLFKIILTEIYVLKTFNVQVRPDQHERLQRIPPLLAHET
jgi:hypothetical protein